MQEAIGFRAAVLPNFFRSPFFTFASQLTKRLEEAGKVRDLH